MDTRAMPEDDPEPLGRETVDGDAWVVKINRIIDHGHYDFAHYEAMKYAHAVIKAVGMMLPDDADSRDLGYRYFQVDANNWREILELHSFPTPNNLLTAMVTRKGPDFIIHDDAEPEFVIRDQEQHQPSSPAPVPVPVQPAPKKPKTSGRKPKKPAFIIHE